MTPFLRKFLGINWILFALMLSLALFGLLAIYSATYMRDNPVEANFWRRQAIWMIIGIVGFFAASLVDYRWVRWGSLPMYLAGLGFLVLTMIIGKKVYGAKSWLDLGGGVSFQPSQLAVLAGILVLAVFLSQFRTLHPMIRLVLAGVIVGAPAALILIQPDFGVTMMWGPVVLAMLFAGGLPLRYLISIILLGVIMLPLLVNFGLKPYQRGRIVSFLDPDIDPQGAAWAINQSLIAVGSGGWAGKGFKAPNTQVEQGFLPSTAVHNDYIFAAIAEQWGFIGGTTLLCAFALLLLTMLYIAYRSPDDLGLLLTVGVTALIFGHVYQNISMTVSMMPVTGVPLPLISYSGSFVVIIMFGLGLVNSVWVHRKMLPK